MRFHVGKYQSIVKKTPAGVKHVAIIIISRAKSGRGRTVTVEVELQVSPRWNVYGFQLNGYGTGPSAFKLDGTETKSSRVNINRYLSSVTVSSASPEISHLNSTPIDPSPETRTRFAREIWGGRGGQVFENREYYSESWRSKNVARLIGAQ